MGALTASKSEKSQPLLAPLPPQLPASHPPPQPVPPSHTPIYGFPVSVPPPYEENPPAYILLPINSLPRRRRNRCCCFRVFSASCSLIAVVSPIVILASVLFLLWPSDAEISIARLRLDRFRIAPHPVASIDIAIGLEMKIRNPDVFAIDYSSIVASIFYRGELLGSVNSAGGRVAARGVTYVNADLILDGARVLGDAIFLISDVAKGSVPFATVTEVQGTLRLFFFNVPIKVLGRNIASVFKKRFLQHSIYLSGRSLSPFVASSTYTNVRASQSIGSWFPPFSIVIVS